MRQRLPHGMFMQFEGPYAVVAHDAGAANLIRAWSGELPVPVGLCAEGPAAARLRGVWPALSSTPVTEALQGAAVLLSGTGSGDVEYIARREAARRGIRSIAVLDHYANWESRFIRDGVQLLPDCIVVADAAAETLARRRFPHTRVERWPNRYLEGEVAAVHARTTRVTRVPPERILVVIEPIVYSWEGDGGRPGEFVAIDYLLEHLHALDVDRHAAVIRLRPHPSDPDGKYDSVLAHHPQVNLEISTGSDLAEDIAWSDIVAGTNSFAMVVAVHAGRPTICILPPPAPRCILPFEAIRHLRDQLVAQS